MELLQKFSWEDDVEHSENDSFSFVRMECVLSLRRATTKDLDPDGKFYIGLKDGWMNWRGAALYYKLQYGNKLALVFDKLYQSSSAMAEIDQDLCDILCSAGNVWMTNLSTFLSITGQEEVLTRFRNTVGTKLLARALTKSEYCSKPPRIIFDIIAKVIASDLPECDIVAVGYERKRQGLTDFDFEHSCAVLRIDGKLLWLNDGDVPSDMEGDIKIISELSYANKREKDKVDRLLSLIC
uniref:ORF6 n=1 Tax=Manihot esculenta associated ampelovirus 1 TaxID=2843331 RepID=A0A8F0FQR3_9CLOS|nr:ORF6 [Manihot esculenta associated ampelovirus 1]